MRLPAPRLLHLAIRDLDIEITILVDINEADSMSGARLRIAQRVLPEQILVQPLLRLTKVEELDPPAVFRLGIVDEIDDLFRLDPAVRMEHETEHALLDDGAIE